MKYKTGDILENGEHDFTIQGVIGEVYIVLFKNHESCILSEFEIEKDDYKKKEREIPPDQTPVKVSSSWVRISSGKLNEDGDLLCYDEGTFKGSTTSWSKWELIK